MLERFDKDFFISKREIRIFLSSTFADLDNERSALVKVFEKIKFEAKKRDVYLTVVDLRWGITEEESKKGKVISVCLDEIENSHPFFIGLLGDRYGYTPSEMDLISNPELVERYPWIESDVKSGFSITEIEMQYGALRRSDVTDAAFFIKNNVECDQDCKLTALKTKIITQNKYEVAYFDSIDDLCDKVEKAIYKMLDKYFPKKASTIISYHTPYINDLTSFYIKNQDDFNFVDAFVNNPEGKFLVIVGESGIGKSALLANWIKENQNSFMLIISHFLGDNNASENSKEKVLDVIQYGLLNHLGKSNHNGSLLSKEEIEQLLCRTKKKYERIVIIIDAVNQLVEQDKDTLLNWFPNVPKGVKIIFSTLENDSLIKFFERNNYAIYHLVSLVNSLKQEFIISYLKHYGKRLGTSQFDKVITFPLNKNILVLKTLLNELICFGSYQQLDERIDYYLSANTTIDFFDKVLSRLESDYSVDCELVKTTLSLIYLSKNGLSEDEIIGICYCREIDWKLFYCASQGNLVSRQGLFSFSHKMIAQAVCNRYHLDDMEIARPYRNRAVGYFRECTDWKRRAIELSYQYYHLGAVSCLHEIVLDFDIFDLLEHDDSWQLACYWRKLLAVGFCLEEYLKLPKDNKSVFDLPLYSIASFIGNYFPNASIEVQYYKCYTANDDIMKELFQNRPEQMRSILMGVANCFGRIGRLDEAISMEELLLRHLKDSNSICDELNSIGMLYDAKKEYEQALKCYHKALEANSNNDYWITATSYCGIAGAYKNIGNYNESINYYLKALLIFEDYFGSRVAGITCYSGLSFVYGKLHKKDIAVQYGEKCLTLITKEYGEVHPIRFLVLHNLSSVYFDNGDYENSLKTLLSIVDTFEHFNNIKTKYWIKVYGNIGKIYNIKNDTTQAIYYYQKAIDLIVLEKDGLESELAGYYCQLSTIYFHARQFVEAATAMEKAVAIYEKTDEQSTKKMFEFYRSLGVLCRAISEYEKAIRYYEKALKYYYKYVLGDMANQKVPVYENPKDDKNIGSVYTILQDFPESIERVFKSLVQEIGEDHPFAIVAYQSIAEVYFNKQIFNKALEAIKHIIYVFESGMVNNKHLYRYACSMAGSFSSILQNHCQSVAYYKKAIDIINYNLDDDVSYRAHLMDKMGSEYLKMEDYNNALLYYNQCIDLLKKSNLTPDFDTLLSLGIIHDKLKNVDISIEYHTKALENINSISDKNVYNQYLIRILGKIGELYYSKNEMYKAFGYFLRIAESYNKIKSNDSLIYETKCAALMAAKIAVRMGKMAVDTKTGYDIALKCLEDIYYHMQYILGQNDSNTVALREWINIIMTLVSTKNLDD